MVRTRVHACITFRSLASSPPMGSTKMWTQSCSTFTTSAVASCISDLYSKNTSVAYSASLKTICTDSYQYALDW